jgi:hypothetical protein
MKPGLERDLETFLNSGGRAWLSQNAAQGIEEGPSPKAGARPGAFRGLGDALQQFHRARASLPFALGVEANGADNCASFARRAFTWE